MTTAKAESNNPAESSPVANAGRRFTDSVGRGARALRVDRRIPGRDRRISITPEYHGAPRRVTIDRRVRTHERRHTN